MTPQDAERVARLLLHRAKTKRREFALFIIADRFSIVHAHGERYERALFRCPDGLVGVYTYRARADAIRNDVLAFRRPLNRMAA